jgi:hypothetical protein
MPLPQFLGIELFGIAASEKFIAGYNGKKHVEANGFSAYGRNFSAGRFEQPAQSKKPQNNVALDNNEYDE